MRLARRSPAYQAHRRATIARRLHDQLRASIVAGHLKGVLPSEDRLVESFSSSRNAVRGALDMLRHDGLVSRVRSIGTTVEVAVLAQPMNTFVTLFETTRDTTKRTVTLDAAMIPAGPYISAALGLPADAECVMMERLVIIHGKPIALQTMYLPPSLAEHLLPEPPEGNLTQFLERLGHHIGGSDLVIEAQPVDELTAQLLEIPADMPVLFRSSLLRDVDGSPIRLTHTRYRADRIALCTWVPRMVVDEIDRAPV